MKKFTLVLLFLSFSINAKFGPGEYLWMIAGSIGDGARTKELERRKKAEKEAREKERKKERQYYEKRRKREMKLKRIKEKMERTIRVGGGLSVNENINSKH